MKLFCIAGWFLLLAHALSGQSVLSIADRQEVIIEGQILRRSLVKPGYRLAPDLPCFRSSLPYRGSMNLAWDGSNLYQVGITEDNHRVVYVGTPYFASGGERQWFWAEPKILPLNVGDTYSFLGAWENSLLFLKIHREAKAKMESNQGPASYSYSQSLLRVDLITGEIFNFPELQDGDDTRNTALFTQGAFYLFTATGKAIRVGVHTEPWTLDKVSSNFWNDAGVTRCKDTGKLQNPFLFGKAFFDLDGSILVPAQIFLPLNREDIDMAWSKLSQIRKAELISSGEWPVPIDKEIGWKDDVCFLKFDPVNAKFSQIEHVRYEHLVVEEDKNFMVRRFRDFEPTQLFTTDGGKIIRLKEALKAVESVPAPALEKLKPPQRKPGSTDKPAASAKRN